MDVIGPRFEGLESRSLHSPAETPLSLALHLGEVHGEVEKLELAGEVPWQLELAGKVPW